MKKILLSSFSMTIAALYSAQVGINTENPLGAFHIDGSKDNATSPTAAQQANDFIVTPAGSTGIGTTTVNNSAKLQVDASNQGLLIPRVTLQAINDGTTISLPAKGLIVYNTNNNSVLEEGFYVNYGTDVAPQWKSFKKSDKVAWNLENIFDVVAAGPVDQSVGLLAQTIDNIDLGLTITVSVPAFTQSKILTIYSVPMGTTTISTAFNGYYGIRFLKNGIELPAGSRKNTISTAANVTARMASITASIGDTVINNTASAINVTYTLNGYLEAAANLSGSTVRYNMWAASGANFNWGKAYMSIQQFLKPL